MATTAVTTATAASTAAAAAQAALVAKRASAQKIISSLGAGSGVDVAALAQGLVDAEQAPQANIINSKITKNEGRVSGYAAVKFMMSNVKDALTALKDANSFNAASVSNSNTSAMSVTASTGAGIGNHAVSISSLASAQRNISTGFAASSTALNAGSSFTMDLTIGTDAVAATSTSTAAVSGLTINGTAIDAVSTDPTVVTTAGYSTATPSTFLSAGDGSTYSTIAVTFSALAAGQSATLDGLTFTATAAMDASAVGDAFASLAAAATTGPSTSLGSYSGTFGSDWSSGTNSSGVVTLTAGSLDTVTDTTGTTSSTSQTEASVVTFSALAAGQKATLNGLTFTATAAMTAAKVASAFSSLTSGMLAATATSTNTSSAALGTYSGTFDEGFTTGTVSGSTVTATSTTSANVTDIAITARKFDNLAIAINAKTSTTGVTAVNTSGSVALTGAAIALGTTANSTKAITGISSTVTVTVAAGYDTPQGLVNAINDAGLAVTARLVNTGSTSSPSYKVLLSGADGSDAAFSLSTTPSSVLTALSFTKTAAADAVLTVDGVSYTRSTNSVTDVVDGLTLDLKDTTTTAASVTLARDTTQVVTKITALVTAYNEANSLLNEVSNSKSTLDIYGGTLVGDPAVRQMRTQLREMLLGESSTPGTVGSTTFKYGVSAAWQVGISVDKSGVMSLDTSKLQTALSENFADVVTAFTANQNNRSATSPPYSSSAGYSSASTSLNGGAKFTVNLTSTNGTSYGFPVTAANATPQGVVDAINATSLGFTAQLVKETSGTSPYKIVVLGSIGGPGFTLSPVDSASAAVSDLSFSSSGSGIAGDALRKITAFISTSSPLVTQSTTAESQNTKYAAALAALQTRMDALLTRYVAQFSAMESLVGNINSQKTSLKSSFDGMMAMYTNK